MHAVDTNVLVYAADEDCPEHARCRALLQEWRAGVMPWYLPWDVLYEFLRVVTHPRVFFSPWTLCDAWRFVEALLACPGARAIAPGPRHAEVAALTLAEVPGIRGNLVHDARIAIVMREHGIRRIWTRDSDFHRFPFLQVLDPLSPA